MSEIKNITVIGAGQMGAGIGLVAAVYGYQVTFYDIEKRFIDNGLLKNKKYLDRQVSKEKLSQTKADEIYTLFNFELDLSESVKKADLVIEAVIENMDIKKKVWKIVGEYTPDHAILGTNTSSLSITEMARSSGHPDRFIGTHFFNPPIIMKIIELVRGYDTIDSTIEVAKNFGKSLNMKTVMANEAPGFIVNRLMIPQLNEAYYALMEGVASKEDIDVAMKFGLNHPMGPLVLSDFIGLDTILFIAEYLHEEIGEKFKPCPLLRKMVRAGKLGRKTGEGFYKY